MTNNLVIHEITSRQTWEQLVLNSEWTPFFQSWEYGEAQQKSGTRVIRLGVMEGEQLIMGAQLFLIRARRGTFFHLRHGPVWTTYNEKAFELLIEEIKKRAERYHALYIRMSPLIITDSSPLTFKKYGFINAPIHNQDAENCLVVPLGEPLETLLATFRKTTRYLIRRAEKENVVIEQTVDPKKLPIFFKLYNETAKRDKFIPHRGIEHEFNHLTLSNHARLFIASHENVPLAASIIIFYGKQGVYHHSGSILSKVPVNYLLQWHAIIEAKKRGAQYYNLWGIAPSDKPHHPWQGLTTFKQGFGGTPINFIHAQDLPLSPLYWVSYLYQKLWSLWRGY